MTATINGPAAEIESALIEALADKGYAWFVADREDATLLRDHGFPVLGLPDAKVLTAGMVRRVSAITVLHPPTFSGALYGHEVKQQLEAIAWSGWLTRSALPEDMPDLASVAQRYPEPQEFAVTLLAIADSGISEQLGAGRPQARAPSKLAEQLAVTLHDRLHFDPRRRRWMAYEAQYPGIWGALDEEDTTERLRQALTPLLPAGFSWNLLRGVERLLRGLLRREWCEPSRNWLPLRNGALHLPTGALHPHTPERGFTWVLPFAYDPLATCPVINAWLLESQSGDPGRVTVLLAYLRAALLGRTGLQRFLECVGPGGTGKGTYQRLAIALVGLDNTHVTELRQLEGNRFETSALAGKRLVVVTDSDRYGGPVTVLKALTGDDVVRSEGKYAEPRTLTPEAMVLVAANEQIQSTDYTSGLERRRISVPFRHKPERERPLLAFRGGEAVGEFVPALPGLLNRVLAMADAEMERVLRHTTAAVPSLWEARTRALVESNGLAHWADHCLIYDARAKTYVGIARREQRQEGRRVTTGYAREEDWLFANYQAFTDATGARAVSNARFSGLLEDLCRQQLGLTGVQRGRDEGGAHVTGLRLRTPADHAIPGLIAQMTGLPTSRAAEVSGPN
jgi:putative DNA primase/helicase